MQGLPRSDPLRGGISQIGKNLAKTDRINTMSSFYLLTTASMAKLQLTSGELAVINISLQSTPDRQPRQFPISELPKALDLQKLLTDSTEERKDTEGNTLLDGNKMPLLFFKNETEVDFSLETKVFVKRLVEEQKWTLDYANEVQSLLEKLK